MEVRCLNCTYLPTYFSSLLWPAINIHLWRGFFSHVWKKDGNCLGIRSLWSLSLPHQRFWTLDSQWSCNFATKSSGRVSLSFQSIPAKKAMSKRTSSQKKTCFFPILSGFTSPKPWKPCFFWFHGAQVVNMSCFMSPVPLAPGPTRCLSLGLNYREEFRYCGGKHVIWKRTLPLKAPMKNW